MLRACRRVLRPGGRIAGYSIHTPAGTSADDGVRAADLGPSEVFSPLSPEELLGRAGFEVLTTRDLTAGFEATVRAILEARRDLEPALRREEGDLAYEEEMDKKTHMLQGISEGLLRRSLTVAARPVEG